MKLSLNIVTLLIFLSGQALAGSLECIGKIDRIYNHKDGRLAIASVEMFGDSNGRDICNLVSSWKDVSAEICKTWLSQMITSYASGKQARVVYAGSYFNQCSDQQIWQSAESPSTVSNW